jgi:alpha-L-rhamnosidase
VPLVSRQIAWWRVTVWTGADSSFRSEPATWEMGLLQPADWQAQWIGGGNVAPNADPLVQQWCEQVVYLPVLDSGYERERRLDAKALADRPDRIARVKAAQPAVWLRQRFVLDKPVARARLYSSALGYYEIYLDGKKVSDRVLDPGQTDYEKRVLYNTDDVTAELKPGPHELRLLLAEGWYGQSQGFFNPKFRYGNPLAIAQLEITSADGSRIRVATDPTWEYAPSAIAKANLYSGEVVDGRLDEASLRWQPVASADPSQPLPGHREAQLLPPTRKVRELPAQSVVETRPGVWLFDFGVNFTGWARLRVNASRGTAIDLKYAELMTPQQEIDWSTQGRRAVGVYQHDRYIAAGGGNDFFEPKFTYHGFRYVEVSGLSQAPSVADITGYLVRTDVPVVGRFTCSDDLMNRVHETITHTYESNLIALPSDCPIREKCGWLGDAHVTQEMSYYNYDMAQFWTKYVRDIQTSSDLHGGLPDSIAPGRRDGIEAFDWGVATVFIPWQQYLHTGDPRILEAHWPYMVRFMEHGRKISRDGIIHLALGDWCDQPATTALSMTRVDGSPFNSLPATTATMHYFHAAKLMAEFARLLGRETEAGSYEQWAEEIREALNRLYYHTRGGTYGSQAANALAVMYGIPDAALQGAVARTLAQEVEFGNDGHFNTGSHGSTYLYHALSDFGSARVAREIFAKTSYPSYGYMFSLGATSLWENMSRFDPVAMTTQKSLSHPFHGGFDHWFYEAVAGVRMDPSATAFKRLLFRPELVGLLASAKGSIETPYGLAASAWKVDGDHFTWEVRIPANTSATVHFPENVTAPKEGGTAVQTTAAVFKGRPVTRSLQLGSGTYRFQGSLTARP